jgi:acetyl esterase/lipase
MKIVSIILLSLLFLNIQAQQKVIPLYQGAAPGSESWNWSEKENDNNMFNTKVIYNVAKPTLTVFTPENGTANGSAVIICPGGGFHVLSINSEGNQVAKWLAKKGYTCFVLKYRLVHSLTDDPVTEMMSKMTSPTADTTTEKVIGLSIADGKAAIAYVRQHAAEYGILPDQIGIVGFSAGGTVAASAGYDYTPENRPNFIAPIYAFMPDTLQKEIPADAPPMFIAAASDDQLGLAPHSVDLYKNWLASKHPVELHMYAKGGHGFGMRKQDLPSDSWIERFGEWLDLQGFAKK